MQAVRILVTSARGGVGTSSSALHIAAALAERGERVLLADLCSVGRSLDLLTGLSCSAVYDLGDLLLGRIAPKRAVLAVPQAEGLYFLPGQLSAERPATAAELSRALATAEEAVSAAYTVLDADFDALCLAAASVVSRVLIVSDTARVSLRAAADALTRLPRSCEAALLLNRFPRCAERGSPVPPVLRMLDEVHLPLVGIIPESAWLREREEAGGAPFLGKRDDLSTAYRSVAFRLTGRRAPLLSGWRGIKRRKIIRRMLA